VVPCENMPSKPYVEEGMTVTLWPYITHEKRNYDDDGALAHAALALQRLHDAFASYPGELPSIAEKFEECAALLRRPNALPALVAKDRTFLIRTYDELSSSLGPRPARMSPIHGDAHLGNVFFTPMGPLWSDFEAACLGPREWDASGVPHWLHSRRSIPKSVGQCPAYAAFA
jgi:thiamine kinase-like enzyme